MLAVLTSLGVMHVSQNRPELARTLAVELRRPVPTSEPLPVLPIDDSDVTLQN